MIARHLCAWKTKSPSQSAPMNLRATDLSIHALLDFGQNVDTWSAPGLNDSKTERSNDPISRIGSPSRHRPVELFDGLITHTGMTCSDDSSDKSITSLGITQVTVLKSIGRITPITLGKIKVKLRDTSNLKTYTFSHIWYVPRLVLKLSARQMALLSITLLVADDCTVRENVLLRIPVLRNVEFDF